jgi:putative ABC transport system permease protein
MLGLIDSAAFDALPYVFLGFGLVLTFRYLKLLDVTLAASFSGGPAVAAFLLVHGAPFALAALAAAGFTVAAAAMTLAAMRFLRLDGLLAGLLTSLAAFAVALLVTQGTLSLGGVTTPFTALQSVDLRAFADGVALHPAEIAAFAILALGLKLIVDHFLQSELGLALRAMEDETSRESLLASLGISRWRLMAIGVIGGNLLSAVSGMLIMLREGQVTASRGFDSLITVVAAYLLGAVLFERRPRDLGARSGLARALARLARFPATTAAVLGLGAYFLLLTLVLRLGLPASTPKLLLVALVLLAFGLRQWADGARSGQGLVTQAPAAGAHHITIDGIDVSYPGAEGPLEVLRGFRAELPAGALTQLVGPNGSGKSTLLKAMAGRIHGRGRIQLPAFGASSSPAGRIAYVCQDAAAGSCSSLSVAENLSMFANGPRPRAWRRWRAAPIGRLPDPVRALVGSSCDLPAGALSGGQRQVLGMTALVLRPEAPDLVLLDEPLTHLDEANAEDCVRLIRQLLADGRTVLLVQHDVNPADTPPSPARMALSQLLARTLDVRSAQDPRHTQHEVDQ